VIWCTLNRCGYRLRGAHHEARALLQPIDHPLAKQWLAKLDEVAPESSGTLKEQMQAARNLIMAKDYTQARAMLQQIDHPTARKWLAKLDEVAAEEAAPTDASAPEQAEAVPKALPVKPAQKDTTAQAATEEPAVEEPAPAAATAAGATGAAELSREDQERRLVEAQELILSSKFEAAQVILKDVTLPEAILWRNKTQMNKFREFQSLWLDLYYYDVPEGEDPVMWKCGECGRSRDDALMCPQQGHKPCPLVVREHALDEPNRLALVLGSIYMGQTSSIKTMLKDASAARLAQWRAHLEQQLNAAWEKDVRRPVFETAIMLLHQLEQTRLLQSKRE